MSTTRARGGGGGCAGCVAGCWAPDGSDGCGEGAGSDAGVRDCAVFGIPDEEFGEQICAYVEPLSGSALDAGQVRAYLAAHVARYKVPKLVEFSAALPREDSGKIFKRKLRAPYWEKAGRSI